MIDYSHDEVEVEGQSRSVGTRFNNKIYVMRLEAQQQDTGRFSGRFGVWGSGRDFSARGEEALAPDVEHGAFAAFAYEELQFGRHRVQLGGRFERNTYDALGRPGKSEHPSLRVLRGVLERQHSRSSTISELISGVLRMKSATLVSRRKCPRD